MIFHGRRPLAPIYIDLHLSLLRLRPIHEANGVLFCLKDVDD